MRVPLRPGGMRLDGWRRILAGASVELDGTCREGVEAGARVVEEVVARSTAVYGINTGFGKLAQSRIPDGDLRLLQRNLLLSHATGVGAELDGRVVRLILALKVASLARGASGVRWEVIERLLLFLERGLLPVIPGKGSVGASGDLAPLAHMALPLMGEGHVRLTLAAGHPTWDDAGVLSARQALAGLGLEPLELGPKEGLALLNGTQVSTALALDGLFRLERIFQTALVVGGLSVDAALGSDVPFDPRIHALRGQPGQMEVAETLLGLLEGSQIRESHRECGKVQDPYSLRCQPQVMGAVLDLMRHAARTLEVEANGVSDNPLIVTGPAVLSGGNFHAEPVALAADCLALAAAEIGSLSERRVAMLTDGTISGLPPFLTPDPGVNSGFMVAHVTAAALASENKQRAAPASVDSIPTSANQEDHVSMATHGARRLGEMAENAAGIVAIEALCATQGVEVHAPLRSSPLLEQVREVLRNRVPPMLEDRYLAPDIQAVMELVESGALAGAAGKLPSVIEGAH